ncbi:MAG: response regulator [Flavobacteriales bacterium]|nr:response regulator [Flavobacteriales bacterium]MCB9167912.1 response regulator [Flavobacteriales bacterium]
MATRMFDIPKQGERPTVLFVDDDAPNRQAFAAAFGRHFHVFTASGLEEAWSFLATDRVDVLITDQRMPGTPGDELLRLVRERFPRVRRMLMTGYADLQAVVAAVNQGGISHYMAKPWDAGELIEAVNKAYAEIRAEEERKVREQQLMEANRQLEFALRQRLLS